MLEIPCWFRIFVYQASITTPISQEVAAPASRPSSANMKVSIIALSFLTTALALPNSRFLLTRRRPSPSLYPAALTPRQSCAETCGNVCYYQSTIKRAVDEGCELYQAGETDVGRRSPRHCAITDDDRARLPTHIRTTTTRVLTSLSLVPIRNS
jgi:hypothetical protein